MFYIIGVNPNIERADRGLMEQIWIEKYRPNNLSEVVGQEAVTTRLKNYVKKVPCHIYFLLDLLG